MRSAHWRPVDEEPPRVARVPNAIAEIARSLTYRLPGLALGEQGFSVPYSLKTLIPLKALEAAVRTGRIDMAASELGVTEPAVVININKLNADFDTELCSIVRGQVKPTPAAHGLADAYRRAMAILDEAVANLPGYSTPVPVAWMSPQVGETFLGREICRLEAKHMIGFRLVSDAASHEHDWTVAIGTRPIEQAFMHNHLITRLRLTFISADPANLISAESVRNARQILAAADTPWQPWLDDQGLSDLASRVRVMSDLSSVESQLKDNGTVAITCRAFVNEKLDQEVWSEARWVSSSAIGVDLYYSRSLRKSFGDESRNLLAQVKSAAIKADIT